MTETRIVPGGVCDQVSWRELTELERHGEGLQPWETVFIESAKKQLLRGLHLTRAQVVRLQEIREERL